MNYFNPYYYSLPTNYIQPKIGILGKLFGKTGVSISNFLNGTQRVLNIANQTIPLVKQVKPMIVNAKTMFKVMNEFKRNEKNQVLEANTNAIEDIKTHDSNNEITKVEEPNTFDHGPTFFI